MQIDKDLSIKKWGPIIESAVEKYQSQKLSHEQFNNLCCILEKFSMDLVVSQNYTTNNNNFYQQILPIILKTILKLIILNNKKIMYLENIDSYNTANICEIYNVQYNNFDQFNEMLKTTVYTNFCELLKSHDTITLNSISNALTLDNKQIFNINYKLSDEIKNVEPANFQECSHLEIDDVFATSKNTLQDLYNLQKDIQENVYGYDFEQMQAGPLPKLREFWDWNYHAIQDELREAFAALGGMSDGISNGVWKPWKKSYTEQAPNMTLNDMSERDKKELKMELIDIQHFLFNMMLSVGMTEQELMNFYFAKNLENRNRQIKGY